MTTDNLKDIKAVAKRLARTRRIQHIAALEAVAVQLGQPHWRGLTEAAKKGWNPTTKQLASLAQLFELEMLPAVGAPVSVPPATEWSILGDGLSFTRWVPQTESPMDADEIHGVLDGQEFYIAGDEFEIAIGSQGWEIGLDQPPSARPVLKRLGGRVKSVEALDPAFIERATQLLRIRARRMHAEVAAAWPRRSTMPDKAGRSLHPLGRGLSAEWHCLHCDGVHSGKTMAQNLWHCPACGATPIDMFPTPFWLGKQASA